MLNTQKFIELIYSLISEYEAGSLDLKLAAEKINNQSIKFPLEINAHPMLNKVANLAYDIVEDYRSDEDDLNDWKIIVETIKNYVAGNWEPTCWILTISYGEYANRKLQHAYSISVSRQNGETLIETTVGEIRTALAERAHKVNSFQTDERYLQNLSAVLPAKIEKFELINAETKEYLTKPYYSTAT